MLSPGGRVTNLQAVDNKRFALEVEELIKSIIAVSIGLRTHVARNTVVRRLTV
jgi:hypothetical protein